MATQDYAAAFDKLMSAATAGDQAATDALDAMVTAAADVEDPTPSAAEQGRAEARRRFGDKGAA